jgi:16S rRNA (guanine966-N2)-methyltransferase
LGARLGEARPRCLCGYLAHMRIVGGKYAGRDLTSPLDRRVRPTAEDVRVALLNRLAPDLPGARVLELFAGTGALGLEALSRGARYVDFVEFGRGSLHALKANIAALRVREKCRVYIEDALPFASSLEEDDYDLVFVDPPYGSRMLDRVIDHWAEQRFSRVLAVEHARSHVLPHGEWRQVIRDSAVTVYRL